MTDARHGEACRDHLEPLEGFSLGKLIHARRRFSVKDPTKKLHIVYKPSFPLATHTDSECFPEEKMTICIRSVCTHFAVATASNRSPTEIAEVPGLPCSMRSPRSPLEGVTVSPMLPVRQNLGIPRLNSELAVCRQMSAYSKFRVQSVDLLMKASRTPPGR
jgi:hypothetical protein